MSPPVKNPGALIPRERIDDTQAMWLAGVSPRKIEHDLAEKYGVTRRTARNYLAIVRRRLVKRGSVEVEAARARAEEMLLETYRCAKDRVGVTKDGHEYSDPDTKSMVAAAHRLAELFGAVGPKRIEFSGPGGKPLGPMIFVPAEVEEKE